MMVPNGTLLPALQMPSAPPQNASSMEDAVHELPVSVTDYAKETALKRDINPDKFQRLIACESQWKEDAAGDNGTSFGILQFKIPTFTHFTKKYKLEDLNIDNPRDQIELAALMISNGHLHHWKNCARKTGWARHLQELSQRNPAAKF